LGDVLLSDRAELGFEHFRSGVWVLDLGARTFQDRMGDLVKSLR
jgi:hypothetical protein